MPLGPAAGEETPGRRSGGAAVALHAAVFAAVAGANRIGA